LTADHGSRRETLKDRIFLFGIRPLLLVIAIVVVGIYVLAEGIYASDPEVGVIGIVITLIGAGLGYGFRLTTIHKITKRYYHVSTVVGKTGVSKSSFDPSNKGVVNVENEYWSAISDERIGEGESVIVISVAQDKVTLKVRKA
jgi:membrane-bound ClpP family serine protease